ncbi:hypothetical protein SpCBS45565_g07867 [Spizellomyces sp. 'palustris']|nr:hypothetical protein SpCBS45565_g07867 [Spizellomyces sp. 'palustris']
MKAIRVQDPKDFDATVASTVQSAPGRVFVLLFGTEDVGTGESWCPDCVIADPLIRKWIGKVPNSVMLEVPVGERSVWKNNPENPYRKHPLIQLQAIPTLIEWGKSGPIKQLVESEAADPAALEKFIA